MLVNWDRYVAPDVVAHLPWTAHELMYGVGAIEILAGLIVALWPRFGGYLVAAWLAGIIVNLLLIPGFYDVALRDFGLLVAALALARLATAFRPGQLLVGRVKELTMTPAAVSRLRVNGDQAIDLAAAEQAVARSARRPRS